MDAARKNSTFLFSIGVYLHSLAVDWISEFFRILMEGTMRVEPAAYRDYKWIVSDGDLLGGQPTVRGTRLSVAFVLACLAEGMTASDIRNTYGVFPAEAIPEVLRLASATLDGQNVAA